jgi:hypothetical protein
VNCYFIINVKFANVIIEDAVSKVENYFSVKERGRGGGEVRRR